MEWSKLPSEIKIYMAGKYSYLLRFWNKSSFGRGWSAFIINDSGITVFGKKSMKAIYITPYARKTHLENYERIF